MEEDQISAAIDSEKSSEQGENGHASENELANGATSDREIDSKEKVENRTSLPSVSHSWTNFSAWTILKQCIGKDLSKITMPVIFNEPLSFLQRIVEYLEYADLLKKASDCMDPIERMELVTAFAASGSASNHERLGKPFNPLLGETYEFDREEWGFKVVCEQVSHHPPVSAFHAESPIFTMHGAVCTKIKFWGKSVEVNPKGVLTLHLLRHNEVYTWQNVNYCIHNVIVGKIWLEVYGTMEVINHKTQHKAVLNFKPCGWFGKDLNKTVGYIYDDRKNKVRVLYGKWTDALYSCDVKIWENYQSGSLSLPDHDLASNSANRNTSSLSIDSTGSGDKSPLASREGSLRASASAPTGVGKKGEKSTELEKGAKTGDNDDEDFQDAHSSLHAGTEAVLGSDFTPDEQQRQIDCDLHLPGQKTLWLARPKAADAKKYFNFTTLALCLNELEPKIRTKMAPTDSRLRQDMRFMEEGNLDASAAEKHRLEEKQRAAKKSQRKHSDDAKPRWFKQQYSDYAKADDWVFTHDYWQRDWRRCPNIF